MGIANGLAKLYRDLARAVCVLYHDPPDSDPDAAFYSYLEHNYSAAKADLARLLAQGAPADEVRSARIWLFVSAAGLLTYGRLDVAEDIVRGIPEGRANMRRLAGSIKALMPLPTELDPLRHPDRTLQWLLDNRNNLTWDASLQRYVSKRNRASRPD